MQGSALQPVSLIVCRPSILKKKTYSKTLSATVEEFQRVLSVNAIGTFLCYKYAAQQMVKQGRGGRIIGASSVAGKTGQKSPCQINYYQARSDFFTQVFLYYAPIAQVNSLSEV